MPCCGCGGCSGSNISNYSNITITRPSLAATNHLSWHSRNNNSNRQFSNSGIPVTLFCLLVALVCCICGASGNFSGGSSSGSGGGEGSTKVNFLAAMLSLCPPTVNSSANVSSIESLLNVVNRTKRDAITSNIIIDYHSPLEIARLSLAENVSLTNQLCKQPVTDNTSELLSRLLAWINRGLLRVLNCEHLSIASVLPQFDGCSELTTVLSAALDGSGSTDSARSLACHCIDSLLNASSNLSYVLAEFHFLVDRVYFTKSSVNRTAHQETMRECQDKYRDWLCSVTFSVYNSSSPASKISPCSVWCQSVETECPYLTPSDETSNSGEPVFLCHEDSYKGANVSDRCTGSSQCCCYEPATINNHSDIAIVCTSPPVSASASVARRQNGEAIEDYSTADSPRSDASIASSSSSNTNSSSSSATGSISAANQSLLIMLQLLLLVILS